MENPTFANIFTGNYLKYITKYSERIQVILNEYDVVIFMARKAVCFYEAMVLSGVIIPTNCKVISSRAIDYDIVGNYVGKKVAIIDDVVVKGTSLERVVSLLKNSQIHPFVLVIACEENFPSKLGDERYYTLSNTYVALEKRDIYVFAGMITEYIEASMCPFNIDQPVYTLVMDDSTLQSLLCNNDAIDITSGLQNKFGITSSVIYFSLDPTLMPDTELFSILSKSVLKIRIMSNAERTIAIPFVLFPEISNSQLDTMFSHIQSNKINLLVHVSNDLVIQENKMKILNYFLSEVLLNAFLNQKVKFEKQKQNDYFQFAGSTCSLFKDTLLDFYESAKSVWDSLSTVSIEYNKLSFTTDVVSSCYQAISTVDATQESFFDSNKKRIEEEIITYEFLCNKVDGICTTSKYLTSCVIDILIDRGMVVPTIVHSTSGILRAYKLGEYSKLTKSQLLNFAAMLYEYQENIHNSLYKTEFEKLCVLFFSMAQNLKHIEQQADFEDDCYSICYSLYGPRISTSNNAYSVSSDSAIATDFYERRIVRFDHNRYIINPITADNDTWKSFAFSFAYQYSELRKLFDREKKMRKRVDGKPTWNMYVHTHIQYLTLRAIGESKKNKYLSLCAELYQICQLSDKFFELCNYDKPISEKIMSAINSGLWKYWCYKNDALGKTTQQILQKDRRIGADMLLYQQPAGDKKTDWDTVIETCGETLYKVAYFINEVLKQKNMLNSFVVEDELLNGETAEEASVRKTIFTRGCYYNEEYKMLRHEYENEVQTRSKETTFEEWYNKKLQELKKEARLQLDLCDLILEAKDNPVHSYAKKLLIIFSDSGEFPSSISGDMVELCFSGISEKKKCKVYRLPDTESGLSYLTNMLSRVSVEMPLHYIVISISNEFDAAVQIEKALKGKSMATMINHVIKKMRESGVPVGNELSIVSNKQSTSFERNGYLFEEISESVIHITGTPYIMKKFNIIKKSESETQQTINATTAYVADKIILEER